LPLQQVSTTVLPVITNELKCVICADISCRA